MTKQSSITIIDPDGRHTHEVIDKLSLERAQELVGGYVEVVPLFNKYEGQPCVVLCDEEGKVKGKGVNNRATIDWYKCTVGMTNRDMLVGTIVIVMGPARKAWG